MDKVEAIMNRWNVLQPLSDRDRELLSRRFTIDFNYNSNHIEGNTDDTVWACLVLAGVNDITAGLPAG